MKRKPRRTQAVGRGKWLQDCLQRDQSSPTDRPSSRTAAKATFAIGVLYLMKR
jgi:hypothetical protein